MQMSANVKVEADKKLLHGTNIYNCKIYQKATKKVTDFSFDCNYGILIKKQMKGWCMGQIIITAKFIKSCRIN